MKKNIEKIAQCQRLSKTLATGGQQIHHFLGTVFGAGLFFGISHLAIEYLLIIKENINTSYYITSPPITHIQFADKPDIYRAVLPTPTCKTKHLSA